MRRLLLLSLCGLMLPVVAEAACSGSSPTWTAASASRADVGDCVDAASPGDTINIPAGTPTWEIELAINKCLHIIGAGEASTIITDNVPKPSGSPDQLIDWTCNAPGVFELAQLKIIGQAIDEGPSEQGHLRFGGTAKQFRVHHLTIDDPTTRVVWINSGHLHGLFDHITGLNMGSDQFIHISHRDWDGHDFGDGSWAAPLAWGTDQAIYIEDSTFTGGSTTGIVSLADCLDGGRYVSRHNTTENMTMASSHGTDSGNRRRSCRSIEAYNNQVTFTTQSREFAAQCRGGTCVVYDNDVIATGLNPGINMMVKAENFRDGQASTPWGTCDGTSPYDQNTPGETGWLCVDQPGAGTSKLLSGVTPTEEWVENDTDPLYVWGNTLDTGGGPASMNVVGSSTHVQSGRDYFNDGTQRPEYTAFAYPHPLQAGFGDPDCTHYASPAGGGDGSSFGSPFQIADFWAVASAGDTLCLRDGTYTGANSMIVPTGTLAGTAGNRITIRALNDGEVLIDGQFARNAIRFNAGFDFFTVEGVNACCNTTSGRVVFVNQADNITIRRVVAWDSDSAANTHVLGTNQADNTLFEDVAGFGTGRKVFEDFTSTNTTFRRIWAQWMGSTHTSPKHAIGFNYDSSGSIMENMIATWDRAITSDNTQLFGVMSTESFDGFDSHVYGSFAYHLASQTGPAPTALLRATQFSPDIDMTNVVGFTDVAMDTIRFDGEQTGRELTNATSIGGNGTNIAADVTVTNLDEGATLNDVSSPYTSATGARLCSRYVDGVLTDTPLWPWPMNQRILDAMTTAGYTPVDVTATVASVLGTIPDACRSDVTPEHQLTGLVAVSVSETLDPNHAIDNLFDDCLTGGPDAQCAVGGDVTSFNTVIDLDPLGEAAQDLAELRLYGDDTGSWFCTGWDAEYSTGNETGPWTALFTGADCNGEQWWTQEFATVNARYIRVTFAGNAVGGTEVRELTAWEPLSVPAAPAGLRGTLAGGSFP